MKKYITTIVLVFVFIGLLGYFWFFESGKENKQDEFEAYEEKSFVVWELNRENINKIDLSYGKTNIKLVKKDDGSWKIVKPKEYNAKEDEIGALLDSVSIVEANGEEIAYENLGEFGLEKPDATIKIGFKDGDEREIFFGDESIDGMEIYTKTSDTDYVFLTDSSLLNSIKLKEEDLREQVEK